MGAGSESSERFTSVATPEYLVSASDHRHLYREPKKSSLMSAPSIVCKRVRAHSSSGFGGGSGSQQVEMRYGPHADSPVSPRCGF